MNKNKIMASLLALVMMLSVFASSFAYAVEVTKTDKVTLHKILMSKENFDKKTEDGEQKDIFPGKEGLNKSKYNGNELNITSFFGKDSKEIAGVYFAWQFKNLQGEWKYIKGNGNGPTLDGKNLQETDDVKQAFGKLTEENGVDFNTESLPQEKPTEYRIVEVRELSKYVGVDGNTLSEMKAVPVEITLPFVNEEGPQKEVHVYPKNTEIDKPENAKKIGDSASAEIKKGEVTIGETVPYVVTTTIKAGSTYNKVAWTDRMSKGLTLDKAVNISTQPNLDLNLNTDYTLTTTDDSFVLELNESGLKKLAEKTAPATAKFKVKGQGDEINGQNTAVTFTLTYSATVNGDAVVNNALENTNTLHYGNNPGYTPEPGDNNPPPVTPKNGEIIVDKKFANGLTKADSVIEWPKKDGQNIEIIFKLYVYDSKMNKWIDTIGIENTKRLKGESSSIKFTGLDNTKQYKVVEEQVPGWVPNYESTEDGRVVIVNKKNDNPPPITPDPVIVRTGGKKFVKTNQEGTLRLEKAEFIVTDSNGQKYLKGKEKSVQDAQQEALVKAETEYQNAVKGKKNTQEIAGLKEARDRAAKTAALKWEWTEVRDDAHKFVTNQDGQWGVYGLAYGKYKFIEVKPPVDYAKNENPIEFTINEKSFNEEGDINFIKSSEGEEATQSQIKDATKIINKKITIPQTGGIGTIIFTVAGLAIMGGAFYVMKKNNEEEEA